MAEKEDFYHELDKKTKRSFCTCQTMAIIFVLLAIAIVAAVLFSVKKIATVVKPTRQVISTTGDVTSLQNKVDELMKAPGASTTLTITEKELTGLLISGINKESSIPLRDVQAAIDSSGITLSATSTEYLKTSLDISVLPKVVDGRLKLELVKIQAGSFAVPEVVTKRVAESLDQVMTKELSQLQSVTVKSVLLNEGSMTITGTIRATPSPSQSENPS